MSRGQEEATFLFFTDVHLNSGCTEAVGFEQQPRHHEFIDSIFQGLREMTRNHSVDLTICGGDFTESGTKEEIGEIKRIFQKWDSPVALCLGNHDLSLAESLSGWRSIVRKGFHLADTSINIGRWKVVLLNTAWDSEGSTGWIWNSRLSPKEALLPSQLSWLKKQLTLSGNNPVILVIHAPTHALPCAQTGADVPLHVPQRAYETTLNGLLDEHPQVKLVLSGHNHVTCAEHRKGRVHLSVSAICEPPFEFALIRSTENFLEVHVEPAIPMPVKACYLKEKEWVNGRPADRRFRIAVD